MKRRKQKGRPRPTKSRKRDRPPRLLERFFRTWLASARRRIRIPVSIIGRSGSPLDMRFVGIIPQLKIYLHNGELGVAVMHRQECWDLIKVIETSPQRRGRGHFCRQCRPETRTVYPTLGRLWREHTFEPFLVWVNETLLTARWLCLLEAPGMTSSHLLRDEHEVSQRVWRRPDAAFRQVQPDGSIRMSPEPGTLIELVPLGILPDRWRATVHDTSRQTMPKISVPLSN